jgi:hypothetical protein
LFEIGGKTMRASKFVAICIGLVAGAALRADAAPVFANNSFEVTTGPAVGWIEIVPFGGVRNWVTQVGGFPAAHGNNALWLGHTDTSGASHLIQTVAGFTVGNTYRLDFAMQAELGALDGRPGAFLGLALTGASVSSANFSVIYPGPPGSTPFFGGAWENKSLVFTATAGAITFDFNGLNPPGGSWESGLDNFRLADVAEVPEPASIALLGLGLAGLGSVQARRKLKTKLPV